MKEDDCCDECDGSGFYFITEDNGMVWKCRCLCPCPKCGQNEELDGPCGCFPVEEQIRGAK